MRSRELASVLWACACLGFAPPPALLGQLVGRFFHSPQHQHDQHQQQHQQHNGGSRGNGVGGPGMGPQEAPPPAPAGRGHTAGWGLGAANPLDVAQALWAVEQLGVGLGREQLGAAWMTLQVGGGRGPRGTCLVGVSWLCGSGRRGRCSRWEKIGRAGGVPSLSGTGPRGFP